MPALTCRNSSEYSLRLPPFQPPLSLSPVLIAFLCNVCNNMPGHWVAMLKEGNCLWVDAFAMKTSAYSCNKNETCDLCVKAWLYCLT